MFKSADAFKLWTIPTQSLTTPRNQGFLKWAPAVHVSELEQFYLLMCDATFAMVLNEPEHELTVCIIYFKHRVRRSNVSTIQFLKHKEKVFLILSRAEEPLAVPFQYSVNCILNWCNESFFRVGVQTFGCAKCWNCWWNIFCWGYKKLVSWC